MTARTGTSLERLRIDGFGHFRDYELELRPGLNLLSGGNEAGKSTLLAFIRSVLFGFERRTSAARYEPERGAFGGELTLAAPFGRVIVRRLGSKRRVEGDLSLRDESGAPLPESRLADALAGVSRELFYEVFAFGLSELQSFERLAEEGTVSAALFAAGMQGAHRLPAVMAQLEKESEGIFTARGSKPALNALLGELGDVQQRLQEIGERPEEYFRGRAQLDAYESRIVELKRALGETRVRKDALSRLTAVLVDLEALGALERQLERGRGLEAIPLDGWARMAELVKQAAAVKDEVARVQPELDKVNVELGWLERAEELGPLEERLRAAVDAVGGRLSQLQALGARRAALEERERQVRSSIQGLGLTLDLEAFRQTELSAAGKAALQAIREQTDEARRVLVQRDEKYRGTRTLVEAVEAEIRRLTAEVSQLPQTDPEHVRQQQGALHAIERHRADREAVTEQLRSQEEILAGLVVQEELPPLAVFPTVWLWGIGALLAAIPTVVAWRLGLAAGLAATVTAAGLFALTVALQRRAHAGLVRDQRAFELRAASRQAERRRLVGEIERLKTRKASMEALESEAERLAGVAPGAAKELLREREGALARELSLVELRVQRSKEMELLAPRLAVGRKDERDQKADRDVAEAALSQLARRLDECVVPKGLPPGLSVEAALELWAEATALRQRLGELEVDRAGMQADEAACQKTVDAMIELATSAGMVGVEKGGPEVAHATLSAMLRGRAETRAERKRLEQRRALLQEQVSGLSRRHQGLESELARLLSEGGCSSVEAYREKAEASRHHRESGATRARIVERIEGAAGAALEEVRRRVEEAGGKAPLERGLLEVEQKLEVLSKEEGDAAREAGALKERLARWEADEATAALRQREEALLARAELLSERYAAARVARLLLDRARRKYEREQQPRVVQLASGIFSELTGGRYSRVFASAGEPSTLGILDVSGREWSAESLSRGTREQLYLAFRLAVIEDFGETRIPLPIILDDILVNFDEERTRSTLKVLARLARVHQVVAFTCHGFLEELFKKEGAQIIQVAARPPLTLVSA